MASRYYEEYLSEAVSADTDESRIEKLGKAIDSKTFKILSENQGINVAYSGYNLIVENLNSKPTTAFKLKQLKDFSKLFSIRKSVIQSIENHIDGLSEVAYKDELLRLLNDEKTKLQH